MKIKYISLLLFALAQPVLANSSQSPEIQKSEREQVVYQYIVDLAQADYEGIAQLFDEGGIVISTSRGQANAKEFFYSFLPQVETATTEIHQTFTSKEDPNRFAARFHLVYHLKNGDLGDGEYVDEFIFAENSNKLAAVYMFENLKFNGSPAK